MKKTKKNDTALLAQGINGIADMYVELKAAIDGCRKEMAALSAKVSEIAHRVADLEGEEYRMSEPERMMQEYCYGKRGDGHE